MPYIDTAFVTRDDAGYEPRVRGGEGITQQCLAARAHLAMKCVSLHSY